MLKLVKQLNDKIIQKKVNNSLKNDNKDYIIPAVEYIDGEIEYLKGIIDGEEANLKAEIMQIALATSLNATYNCMMLEFSNQKTGDENFTVKFENGKLIIPKLNGTNGIYINIVNKYLSNFQSVGEKYNKLQPFLKHRHKLFEEKNIVLGKNLYEAYSNEYTYNLEAKKELKRIQKNLLLIRQSIFTKTGWYEINPTIFGTAYNDVDKKVVNAVILKDRWVTYSTEDDLRLIEEKFIDDNSELLNQYRNEYRKLSRINEKQSNLADRVKRQIDERNSIIEKVKQKKNNESKKQFVK